MADIAILIAEEYERRMKEGGRKSSSGEDAGFVTTSSCVVALWGNLKDRMMEFVEARRTLDPEYQISLAASTGFFSA